MRALFDAKRWRFGVDGSSRRRLAKPAVGGCGTAHVVDRTER
jgi:hypothetical protein